MILLFTVADIPQLDDQRAETALCQGIRDYHYAISDALEVIAKAFRRDERIMARRYLEGLIDWRWSGCRVSRDREGRIGFTKASRGPEDRDNGYSVEHRFDTGRASSARKYCCHIARRDELWHSWYLDQ